MNPARPLIDGLGLGPAYHDLWWRIAARRRPIATDWNRKWNTIFIHVPKAAGLSLYEGFGMTRSADTHAPAAAWRREDPAFFDQAYRFAVVRNPWDRLVSAYHYLASDTRFRQDQEWARRMLRDIPDFAGFLEALQNPWFRNRVLAWRHFLPQSAYVQIGGELAVDHLIDFAALEAGALQVAATIGVPYQPTHANRSRRGDYRSYYRTEAEVELVAHLYAEDIALLGARFEPG